MPEEQISEVFDTLFEAVRHKPAGGRDLSGVPAHAQPAPVREEKKPITKEQLRKMFDPNDEENFNPQAAMKMMVEENYSGILNDIGRNASVGMKAAVRTRLPDFDKYEQDIDTVLATYPPTQVTADLITNTYFQVKGYRQTEAEIRDRQKPPTTAPPSPARREEPAAVDDPEILAVARVMFPGSPDPLGELKKAEALMTKGHIRVPGDPKPKPKEGR